MMAIAYGGMIAGLLLFITMAISILRQSRQDNDKPDYTVLTTKQLLETTDDPDLILYRNWKAGMARNEYELTRDPDLYMLVQTEPGVSFADRAAFNHMCLGELGHPMYDNLDTSTIRFTDIQFEFLCDLFPDKVSHD